MAKNSMTTITLNGEKHQKMVVYQRRPFNPSLENVSSLLQTPHLLPSPQGHFFAHVYAMRFQAKQAKNFNKKIRWMTDSKKIEMEILSKEPENKFFIDIQSKQDSKKISECFIKI